MNNMKIWGSLEKTDPAYTKQFTRGGGFKGTALNGTYIVRRLTEEFGPCGCGWKFVIEDERIETGHILKSGDTARVHIIRGHLEYRLDGEWYSTSSQFGQTMMVDENKYGTFTDEEAPKKSVTDCQAKCAVLLGIGADIHLGLYDDNKYMNVLRKEFSGHKSGALNHDEQKSDDADEPFSENEISPDEYVQEAKKVIQSKRNSYEWITKTWWPSEADRRRSISGLTQDHLKALFREIAERKPAEERSPERVSPEVQDTFIEDTKNKIMGCRETEELHAFYEAIKKQFSDFDLSANQIGDINSVRLDRLTFLSKQRKNAA